MLKTIKCVKCSINNYPSNDGTKCLPCQETLTRSHSNCLCPLNSHIKINNYCFKKSDADINDIRNNYLIHYFNESIDSYYLRKELRLASYLCKVSNQFFFFFRWLETIYFLVQSDKDMFSCH